MFESLQGARSVQRGCGARGTNSEERLGTDSDNSWRDTRLGGRRGSCGEKRRARERERERERERDDKYVKTAL